MSWRSIVSRVAAVAFGAAVLPGCGDRDVAPENPEEGEALKVSYYRAYPEPRTKKPEPTYRVVMSNTWRDKFGESVRDPFVKAAPGKLYIGYLTDGEMARVFKLLRSTGIDRLKARNSDDFNPAQLYTLALNPPTPERNVTRVMTIATDKWGKSYYFPDHEPDVELRNIYFECEKIVSRVMDNSVQVRIYSEPFYKKDNK